LSWKYFFVVIATQNSVFQPNLLGGVPRPKG